VPKAPEGGDQFPLSDLIGTIGRDLREAERRARDSPTGGNLNLKEITVELGITWERSGSGGIEFWVVKLGAA
jgi:hypothetical protein